MRSSKSQNREGRRGGDRWRSPTNGDIAHHENLSDKMLNRKR